MEHNIDFDIFGIAEVLQRFRLKVPPNQREYSWEANEVKELLTDLSNAIRSGSSDTYFLGTIVLTKGEDEAYEVADGQQRLATTTMILSYVRDYFLSSSDTASANSIESEYLFKFDLKEKDILPRLTLNLDDNEFFRNAILKVPGQKDSKKAMTRSNRLISGATHEIRNHFSNIQNSMGTHFPDALIEWVEFLKKNASVVTLRVLDKANAFMLFETLNDRGLKMSQADLVKNYLFGKAVDRGEEAQMHWSKMKGAIDSVGDDGDLTLDFLRLTCCLLTGATREREIMERIQNNSATKSEALKLLLFIDELSLDYAAILNPDHPKWNNYDESARKAIKTMNVLGVTQIRPLMLAISRHFSPAQTAKSFKRMVSWSVRILVEGIRGGKLDEAYARLANEIHTGKITSDEVLKSKGDFIPTNAQFQKNFEEARVSVNRLARYYLRSLETTAQGEKDPEFVPNDDLVINLEHVMSNVPSEGITPQDIQTHYTRIGNLALLQAEKNSAIGSLPFSQKKPTYKKSSFLLTSQIAELDSWNTAAIEQRQKKLAELAVKTWP